jgi:hypothetical protein
MGSDEMLRWLDTQDQKQKAETRRAVNKFSVSMSHRLRKRFSEPVE